MFSVRLSGGRFTIGLQRSTLQRIARKIVGAINKEPARQQRVRVRTEDVTLVDLSFHPSTVRYKVEEINSFTGKRMLNTVPLMVDRKC